MKQYIFFRVSHYWKRQKIWQIFQWSRSFKKGRKIVWQRHQKDRKSGGRKEDRKTSSSSRKFKQQKDRKTYSRLGFDQKDRKTDSRTRFDQKERQERNPEHRFDRRELGQRVEIGNRNSENRKQESRDSFDTLEFRQTQKTLKKSFYFIFLFRSKFIWCFSFCYLLPIKWKRKQQTRRIHKTLKFIFRNLWENRKLYYFIYFVQ